MKTKYLVLLISVAVLINPQLFAQKSKANRLFDRFEYAKSIPYYEKLAAKQNKHKVHAMTRLGDSYRLISNFEASAKWYDKLIASGVNDAGVYFNYGQVLRSLGKYDEAVVQFERYAVLNPADPRGALFAGYSIEVKNWVEPEYVYEVINAATINSEFSDFSPVYVKDGMVFTTDRMAKSGEKRYGWTGAYYLDLFFAQLKKDDDLDIMKPGSPSVYSSRINQAYHDGPATFSQDFNTIYFTRVIRKAGELDSTRYYTNRLKLYSSTMEDGKWSEPKPFFLNSDAYSVGHPSLSADGQTMYFASDMPGGFGGTDLYRVKRTGDGWGPAENLGAVVNTFGNEMFPYLHQDSVLYFSSDGHAGLGSLDIFKSIKNGDAWSKPGNLKAPVNSPADDFGIVISSNGREGMISSNRPGGKGEDDIYLLTISERLPDSVMITGLVKDKETLETMKNATVFVLNTLNNEVMVLKTGENGRYTAKVKRGSSLVIKGIRNGFYPDCLSLAMDNKSKAAEIENRNLLLAKYKVDQIFRLENIYYDFDKWNIRPDAATELDKVVIFLKENPGITVELGSHTDSRGSFKYNERLSDRRAKSAVDYIISRGIDKGRITANGYGEYKLVNRCADGVSCSEEEHQENRRTEIKISGAAAMKDSNEGEPLDNYKSGQILRQNDFNEDFFNNCNDSESRNILPIYSVPQR